jgi:hypothetical protein
MKGSMKFQAKARLAFAVCWITLIITGGLLLSRIILHSDSLFLDDLSTSLFAEKGKWSDWKLTPAPAYIPDMLLYFLGYGLLPTPPLRILFVSICQAMLLAIACIWFCRKVENELSKAAECLILLILILITGTAANSSMWLYFNSTNNHFASLLLSIVCLGLVLDYICQPSKRTSLLLLVVAVLAQLSTPVFLISFTIPALAILVTTMLLLKGIGTQRKLGTMLLSLAAALVGSTLLSKVLEKVLVYHDAFTGRTSVSVESLARALGNFGQAWNISFASNNKWTLLVSILILCAFLFLLAKLFSAISVKKFASRDCVEITIGSRLHSDPKYFGCYIFLAVGAPLNVIGAITSGGFLDAWGFRYFLFPICLALLLCVLSLERWILKKHSEQDSLPIAIAIAVAAISVAGAAAFHAHNHVRLPWAVLAANGIPKIPEDKVADCVQNLQLSGYKLDFGIADFWMARGITYRLPDRNRILAVLQDATPFFHMTTLATMRPYDDQRFNFVILNTPEQGGQFGLTPASIGTLLPTDHEVHFCAGTDMQIWTYSGDSLDAKMRRSLNSFLFSLGQGDMLALNASQLPGLIGQQSGEYRIAKAGIDKPGFLTYGPYIRLGPGAYHLKIEYSANPVNAADMGYWDIGRFNSPSKNVTLKKGPLEAKEDGKVELNFTVPGNGIEQFEIRSWFNGGGELTVKSVNIHKAE